MCVCGAESTAETNVCTYARRVETNLFVCMGERRGRWAARLFSCFATTSPSTANMRCVFTLLMLLYTLQLALIQIAAIAPLEGRDEDGGVRVQCSVHLIHVARMGGRIPGALADLLNDSDIVKTGRHVGGDAAKILRDGKKPTRGILELGRLCRERGLVENGGVSLEVLAAAVLQKKLPKDVAVRFSRWDQDVLTDKQKRYAALDAWASLRIAQAALQQPDRTLRLTAETAVAGLAVDLLIGNKVVASGEIVADSTWGGVPCTRQDAYGNPNKDKVVMRVDYVYVPAAFVPFLPKVGEEPAAWPPAEHTDTGKRVRPTLDQLRDRCESLNVPCRLLVSIKSLTPQL